MIIFMKNLKNGFSNKITIYQMPLLERVLGLFSVMVLLPLPILGLSIPLYSNSNELLLVIILLISMIIYSIFMYLNIFKTYICLDVQNQKLIIRESPGFKKEELYTDNIIDIKVSDGIKYKELFTIDINYGSYTKKINSWSAHPTCRLAMFGVYRRQTKRLEIFAKLCNEYLNNRTTD